MRRIGTGCLLALLIPYIVTLVWTGTVKGEEKRSQQYSGKKVIMEGNQAGDMDVEEYLIGVVGKQIPADYGSEALKAQAIIARTYIYKQMGDAKEVRESDLNMDYLEEKQLERLWGSDKFVDYYKNIEQAVEDTGKTIMTYEEQVIDPLFHRSSSGYTRAGDEYHPYLESVESLRDVEAEDYLSVISWDVDTFVSKINVMEEGIQVIPEQIPESIQLIERDRGGYVGKIQIGNHTFTGEALQKALDLPSSSFTLEGYEGQVRAICKGIGHGLGMSQYGAKIKAGEGMSAEDILNYYYKNIVLFSG